MCSVTAVVATTVASTAFQAIGQYQAGRAERKAANYQAAVQENNAQMAEYAAEDALRRGEEEKGAIRRRSLLARGQGRSSFAAGNILLGTGSQLLWEDDMDDVLASDLNTTDYNARMEAWSNRYQGANMRADAGALRAQGRSAARAGRMGAFTSLLGGGASAAYQHYSLTR